MGQILSYKQIISDSAAQTSFISSVFFSFLVFSFLFFFFFLEDFQPLANHSAPLCQSLARLIFRKRAVLDGVRIVAVGTAEGTGVCPQDGAQDSAIRCLQDVCAVNLLRCAVIPTEDAHLRLRLAPLSLFASSVHREQVQAGETSSVGG